MTKSASTYLKDVLKQRTDDNGGGINWNCTYVEKTIEKLESEDEKSGNSSDCSEQMQQKRVDRIVSDNITCESSLTKVNSFIALNKL